MKGTKTNDGLSVQGWLQVWGWGVQYYLKLDFDKLTMHIVKH